MIMSYIYDVWSKPTINTKSNMQTRNFIIFLIIRKWPYILISRSIETKNRIGKVLKSRRVKIERNKFLQGRSMQLRNFLECN